MKSLVRSLLAFSASTFVISQANAAPLTCKEIDKANAEGAVVEQPFNSDRFSDIKLQIKLLKKAVVIAEVESQEEVDAQTAELLIEKYDPIFKNIAIGKAVFHSVNLDLGDNPYVYLFDLEKGEYVDIMSADGSIMVGRDYCDATDVF